MSFDAQDWENIYLQTAPDALPWNAGGPDPDLVRLVKAGTIPVGQALDIGTGPGHDAVFLIQHGFNVIGIDISPTAIILARENASNAGLFGFFQAGDIRQKKSKEPGIGSVFASEDYRCWTDVNADDIKPVLNEKNGIMARPRPDVQ